MGGVQQLLDGVLAYLPNPTEVHNEAIDVHTQEKVPIKSNSDLPVVALAFKLEENKYGQLTYMRVYQGTLRRGDTIFNVNLKQRMKVPRLIKCIVMKWKMFKKLVLVKFVLCL